VRLACATGEIAKSDLGGLDPDLPGQVHQRVIRDLAAPARKAARLDAVAQHNREPELCRIPLGRDQRQFLINQRRPIDQLILIKPPCQTQQATSRTGPRQSVLQQLHGTR
jgi:hypothetical protein